MSNQNSFQDKKSHATARPHCVVDSQSRAPSHFPITTETMSYPLLAVFTNRKSYLQIPGLLYTASMREDDGPGRKSLLHTVISGQRALLGPDHLEGPASIPTVSEWMSLYEFNDFNPENPAKLIFWTATDEPITVEEIIAIHQMAINLASSNPSILFESDWIEADN